MACVAVLAVSSAAMFARLALVQDLSPALWGFLGLVTYFGTFAFLSWMGADLGFAWIGPLGGLFLLFIAQVVAASNEKKRRRG